MESVLVNSLSVSPTRLWGDVPLFGVSDSLELIGYCEKNDIAVLGIEGFRVNNDKRVPDMDYIVDFSELFRVSGKDFTEKSLQISKSFVQSVEVLDIYFEFLLVKC
ncbi:hypothetical protein FQZ97_1044980 [compost metagenome]